MRVSTFELLLTTIAPPLAGAIARRVAQGYFLTIANLENRALRLRLRLTSATNVGNRVIASGNAAMILDTGTLNDSALSFAISSSAGVTVATSNAFVLAPKHTGLVAVLPRFPIPPTPVPTDLEFRGFVELIQTKTFAPIGPAVPPAQVLLTAENRGTYLDESFRPSAPVSSDGLTDFDQLAYSLPLASGRAENTVEGLPGIHFPGPIDLDPRKFRQNNPELSDEELAEALEALRAMSGQ